MLSKVTKLGAWMRRHSELLVIDPIERQMGGRAGGLLYTVAGSSAALYPLLPGSITGHLSWLYAIAALSLVWGLLSLFCIDWTRMHPYVTHLSTLGALGGTAIAVASSGGSRSFAWIYLFWVGLFGCYFYSRPVALFYIGTCILTQALPLLYDPRAVRDGFLSQLIVAAAGYATIGSCVSTGKRMIDRMRVRAETLAAEQAALRRAAGGVMRGDRAELIFESVSADLAALVGSSIAGVMRLLAADEAVVVGSWRDGATNGFVSGSTVRIPPDGGFSAALAAGAAMRSNELPASSVARALGHRSTIIAPIMVEGRPWGLISVASPDPHAFTRSDERRVGLFAETLARIVASLEERARLEAEALTDQLTGLPNQRALHQRLVADLAAAARHGAPLSVAMIDVDNFKEINDRHGHDRGDRTLSFVADCMRRVARASDTIGRLGGDEFMWILPDTDCSAAVRAVERARESIARGGRGVDVATTSVGICDTGSTRDAAELIRLADVALYAGKASGRNQVTLYDADVARALDAQTRAAWLERSQALAGLRALARAIDAKDPATSRHSERVAEFVGLLAQASGWSDARVARLREAALVHDVGKLAVPDALLTKSGRFTERERSQMQEHVELSARIVGSVLSEEQVAWIRGHHERADGAGYPAGLDEREIPDGAALMALADAWDVMVAGRSYSRVKGVDEAYAECLELEGAQFTSAAVHALRELRACGGLQLAELDLDAGGELLEAAGGAISR